MAVQGLDIGPQSQEEFQVALKGSRTVLWNGPMGVFEFDKFATGTSAIAQTVAELTGQVCLALPPVERLFDELTQQHHVAWDCALTHTCTVQDKVIMRRQVPTIGRGL